MKGINKFENAISETAKVNWLPIVNQHKDEFVEILGNYILDLDGPKHVNRNENNKELYFRKVFNGFNEITTSLQSLEDIAFYINRFPFRGKKITPERYLQFHVEAYYSEVYILSLRLNKYLTLLERIYKKDSRFKEIKKCCETLSNLLEETLKPLINLRGSHVHVIRFKDERIKLLVTLSGFCSNAYADDDELSKLFKNYYQEKYREVKKSWKNIAKNNNKNIRKLLDFFFEKLYPLVFNQETGDFLYPSRLRG